jgi:hypothetical protein
MRPIPDVQRIGGPNLFVYRTPHEYIETVKDLMRTTPRYSINLENYSWKEKARQFEAIFKSLS